MFKKWILARLPARQAYAGMTILIFFSDGLHLAFANPRYPAYNEISVDFPIEGGGMLMVSRSWPLNRFFDVGIVGGSGVIERDFEVTDSQSRTLDVHTKAAVFPFIGPRLSLNGRIIGLTLAYGAFYAKTDFKAMNGTWGDFSNDISGWGSGFYSPLLVLDFYVRRWDLLVGLGLGGFLGTSYPNLEASSSTGRVSTAASPISTLTIHLRTRWFDGRKTIPGKSDDEF